jgi:hypothetical protein
MFQMPQLTHTPEIARTARLAGLLYLVIIVTGLGAGLAIAGIAYFVGSGLRFFAPDVSSFFMPAYGLTVLAETAFCLRLLPQKSPR